ncbi:aldo/keto reductase [Rubrobacter calidifluminis]|uniref:aldo/keto reductase n=1 Tax=Rubrobacter calidifluminis TaxID=1392640 RepID=UPI002361636A|nr:aldo/keto reductase [Rubrobacter calidifluminis]
MQKVKANGAEIPVLGFGTYRLPEGDAERMVSHALGVGYRHVDTAQMYGNEAGVGRALESSGVGREEFFLTTKVWPDRFRHDDLLNSVDESLRRLRTEYVDLLLLHWPNPEVPLEETIGALNEVRSAGKTRHIGVSNFTTKLVERAVSLSEAPLVTDQVEYHPYLDQSKLFGKLRSEGMALTAYSPLAKGRVQEDETLREIGSSHGKSPGQVALRWLIQQEGVVAIPKTSNPGRAEENFDIFDFELSQEEMERISFLARPDGRITSPAGLAPEWD